MVKHKFAPAVVLCIALGSLLMVLSPKSTSQTQNEQPTTLTPNPTELRPSSTVATGSSQTPSPIKRIDESKRDRELKEEKLIEATATSNAADTERQDFEGYLKLSAEDRVLVQNYEAAEKKGKDALLDLFLDPNVPLEPWKLPSGRAEPIVCGDEREEYFSGHFSIPSENLIEPVKKGTRVGNGANSLSVVTDFQVQEVMSKFKRKDWAMVVPGRKNTYVFKEENLYQKDLEKSLFAITRRRFGWATNRNLEMLAAGVIPFFCGAEKWPRTGTLGSLPQRLLRFISSGGLSSLGLGCRCNPHKKAFGFPLKGMTEERFEGFNFPRAGWEQADHYNLTAHSIILKKLLQHTIRYQTSTHMARYFLSATSLPSIPTATAGKEATEKDTVEGVTAAVGKNVLVLWASHYSIMLTSFIHGLRTLGVGVEDVPKRPEIYKETPDCKELNEKDNGATSYAKGWFFMCRVPETPNLTRSNIETRIRERDFSLIVISVTDFLTYKMTNVSEEIPYWDVITTHYKKREILIMNDADLLKPMQTDVAHKKMWRKGLYFKRETHGCNEPIW